MSSHVVTGILGQGGVDPKELVSNSKLGFDSCQSVRQKMPLEIP